VLLLLLAHHLNAVLLVPQLSQCSLGKDRLRSVISSILEWHSGLARLSALLKNVEDIEIFFLQKDPPLLQALTHSLFLLANGLRPSVDVRKYYSHETVLAVCQAPHFLQILHCFYLVERVQWVQRYSQLGQLKSLDKTLREGQRLISCLV